MLYFFTQLKVVAIALLLSCSLSLSGNSLASEFTEEQLKWLNSDEDTTSLTVNEGSLKFLTDTKDDIFHSKNILTITKQSIDDGWVKLQQCYQHIDAISEVDIEYRYHSMKNFKVLSTKNIESTSLKNQTVTLKNIKTDAEICIAADVRIFYQNPDLTFSLVNGPFHRRFLDGFYPYHISLNIHYPDNLLKLIKTDPPEQTGFDIKSNKGQLLVNSVFEGILKTEVVFGSIKPVK